MENLFKEAHRLTKEIKKEFQKQTTEHNIIYNMFTLPPKNERG